MCRSKTSDDGPRPRIAQGTPQGGAPRQTLGLACGRNRCAEVTAMRAEKTVDPAVPGPTEAAQGAT